MLDRIIRNGQVVTPNGVGVFDVGIEKDKIAALGAPGSLPAESSRVIDATGKIVVPGGIDPHIHMKWLIPASEGLPETLSGEPAQVSRAALWGGTTTLIDFAAVQPGDSIEATIVKRDAEFKGKICCDFAYHVMLLGDVPPPILDEIERVIAAGYASVKIFTTDITPSRKGRKVPYGDIWEVLQRVAKAKGIAAIHAEDDELVKHMYAKLEREGRTHFTNMPEVHNSLSEDLSFRRIIRLAESVEGAALYMMHVSAATGVEAIAESRAKGFPIYGETLHQYALYSSKDYFRPNGQIYHTYPSLKEDADRRALWRGMADGTIGTVATDGICTLLKVKTRGERIDDVTGGNAGVEPRMGIIFTEAVSRRGMSLERFVDLTSANAAKLLGLYPRKGAIAAGSDADLCIIDPAIRKTLTNDMLHESDYSPWEGWEIIGWPVTTLLRGKIVVDGGKFFGDLNDGQWQPRKISEHVLFGQG